MATSITSLTPAEASTLTMSGRGTITSRTTVSPNSMIEWMRARSSFSITSSSTATSAMASSSSSERNGPCLRPLPGSSALASPMRPVVSIRTGGKRTIAATGRAANNAARSECWSAHVFGAASAKTKITITSKAVATATPRAPKSRSPSTPTRVAATSWQSSSRNSTELRKRSGCSMRRVSAAPPRRPSSSSVMALTRLTRVSAVSAAAKNPENTISTMIAAKISQSAPSTLRPHRR